MLIGHNKLSIALILLILVIITGASISVLALPSTTTVLTTVVSQVGSSANDAEESLNSGNVSITSPDLQLGAANNTAQLVGIRFTNITIPHNAVIVNAYMEFEVGATGSTSTSITIQGQAIDNAPAFTSAKHNISARPRTITQVAWNNIPAWPALNAKWETPNISAIIQEVVNRSKWVNGNSIVILINGSGQRTAKSYDGDSAAAPRLIINFMLPTLPVTVTTTDTPTPIGTPTPFPSGSTHFAVIGDYGTAGQPELDVANLVKSWNPDFVITTGDNNYPDGAASTIDANIGQYYQEFIYPYVGSYGPGAATNRFFPTLGNHDWYTTNAQPYLDYFSLPGNERYYDLVWGPVHLFVIDSDPSEPDGNSSVSPQAQWLQAQLAASTSSWNLVFMHHPPYSSGSVHGSTPVMQWPYQLWGASAVFAGHDHLYERIFHDGISYFVNGLGGTSRYGIGTPVAGSQIRYDADYGAMSVTATDSQITFQFIARTGAVIDTYTLSKPSALPPSTLNIVRAAPNPNDLITVDFIVTFSKNVTGVDASDFALTTTGVSGASISGVSGSGTTYTVNVNTGTGNGTIRLDVVDDDSIVDIWNNPLGGIGIGNGDFNLGETYNIVKANTISGNAGVGGAILSYTGGAATADGNGNYTMTVASGWSGIVTPSKACYTFNPINRSYIGLAADQTNQDFVATYNANALYTLTGNTSLPEVTLSYMDGILKTVISDGGGNYTITVPCNWSGMITPSKVGYLFAPAVNNYSILTGDLIGQNFNLYNVSPADFNGDGKTDVAVFRASNSTWYIQGQGPTVFGQAGDIPVPADYNGDGKAELAVFRPSSSTWYIQGQGATVFGAAGDTPVVADYNGDGKADIAVFRPSNSTWYIKGMGSFAYGQDGDIPVVADYNGDGKADIAMFRPTTSTWYLYGIGPRSYGMVGDVPVIADYNGDGKADIAVFRPTNSTWYIYGIGPKTYGMVGDIPVIGDYNGDKKADIAVFRPTNSTWYIYGVGPKLYGTVGDIPV